MEKIMLEMVAAKMKALSAGVRLRILQLLMECPHTVNELVEITGEKQSNISKHLKILAQANIVAFDRDRAFRLYRLADKRAPMACRLFGKGVAEELAARSKKSGQLTGFAIRK